MVKMVQGHGQLNESVLYATKEECSFIIDFNPFWTTDRYCMSGVVMIDVLFRFVWFPRKEYIDHNGLQLFWIFSFLFMNLCFHKTYWKYALGNVAWKCRNKIAHSKIVSPVCVDVLLLHSVSIGIMRINCGFTVPEFSEDKFTICQVALFQIIFYYIC